MAARPVLAPSDCLLPMLRLLALLLILVTSPALAQQEGSGGASTRVFRRFADQVLKVEVVETSSAAKATIGSGFYVSDRGHVVTNYHVISQLVHAPERYRAEVVDARGETRAVAVLAIDVVHDLAVLRADVRPAKHFALEPVAVSQGDRLFALGHPHDLGLSIVEGTYNGLLEHTLYPKIHFTGSLNPGMSGGPTLAESGHVVGVNVSTAGNQVSFLVPVERAATLVATTLEPGFAPPKRFLAEVGRQVRAYQDVYLADMFGGSTPTVALGGYTLPTKPAPFFKCWADATRRDELPYQVVEHQCSTDDVLYISGGQSSGVVEVEHRVLSSRELGALRFYSLLSGTFASGDEGMYADDEEVTPFRCETRNVTHHALAFRAALCLRRYRKLDGLYDAVLRAAALGGRGKGLVTTLTLSGVSFENAQRVAGRYLERITWRE
ncbi:MAG: serine protease [Gemmatimonadaceae bacterium]